MKKRGRNIVISELKCKLREIYREIVINGEPLLSSLSLALGLLSANIMLELIMCPT